MAAELQQNLNGGCDESMLQLIGSRRSCRDCGRDAMKPHTRECGIAAGAERGMRREHVPSERVEWVPARFCRRDAKKPHARSVYFPTRTVILI
ncbi:hypothetical protein Y032_0008g276 [Ancylostoma ceylanicum]|uniref:Uncharacterized protein n=1 Tax=Ancylostoma ceylanicum TaxID=53326 RepID=A0A016VMJ9_9BILA|nr:hypothetical protein Y032_0008g276 [Ancylostoma ceylanicum]